MKTAATPPTFLRFLVPALFVALTPAAAAKETVWPITHETSIRPVGIEEARTILRTPDEFTRNLSPFDRSARLHTAAAVTNEQFLDYVASQAAEWTDAELALLGEVVEKTKLALDGWRLALPAEIRVVRTTGLEEGGAAYTRGDSIILPPARIGMEPDALQRLLLHELFHIISRNNPELRNGLYAQIGFEQCGEVPLPAGHLERKLTNPDAPLISHFIELSRDGRRLKAMPVLFSSEPGYPEGDKRPMFAFLKFRLMEIEHDGAGWRPVLADGAPVFYTPYEVEGYFEKIGRNTNYIIHPEEVLADNFVFAVLGGKDLKNPEIPEGIRGKFVADPEK